MTKLRVAILYGGRSAEHEVSVVSARSVMAAIDRSKYDVVPIAITKAGRWMLPEKTPEQLEAPTGSLPGPGEQGTEIALTGGELSSLEGGPIDVVFPVLHGPYGEDGTVQGMLELAGVAYVGAGVLASALGMDKEKQKQLLASRGLPVVPYVHVHAEDWHRSPESVLELAADEIGLPCFTKPARLGSSIGVSKCTTPDQLRKGITLALEHDDKILVEKAITGRELECAVLGNTDPEASIVGEIVAHHDFYDFEAKYIEEGSELRIPAPIPDNVSEEIRRLAVEAFRAIDCAGMARVDFFYEDAMGAIFVNEINTIPGFTPISMYPKLWEATGIPYAKLIDRLIELAVEEHGGR